MPDCKYPCSFHKGKIEWHHPIEEKPEIGLYLCEAHHSIIQGRKKRYAGEMLIDKSLEQMKAELKRLEYLVIQEADSYVEADKH